MLLIALFAVVGSLRGAVVTDGQPLPGVAVTLSSPSFTARRVADARGEYEFTAVPAGVYDLTCELAGADTVKQRVTIREGRSAIRLVEMEMRNVIVLGCRPCTDALESPFELPSCSDYELNSAWMENAENGDRSAIDLLEDRYAMTSKRVERMRIGGFLLGKVRDDSAIWSELLLHATNAVDFADDREKLEAWCTEHGCDPDTYKYVAGDALDAILRDRRARPLLLRALHSPDVSIAYNGVAGLAFQHDESALPEIEKAVQERHALVFPLAFYESDAVDRLAAKYLKDDGERAGYRQGRVAPTASPSP